LFCNASASLSAANGRSMQKSRKPMPGEAPPIFTASDQGPTQKELVVTFQSLAIPLEVY
jgi:hypothetical protein